MTRLEFHPFLFIDLSTFDAIIGSGAVILMVVVVAPVIITLIKVLFQVWLIKYVRSLNKEQFKRVQGILRPLHDMDGQNIVMDVFKKLKG